MANDPKREITDAEFEEMVAQAGELTVRALYPAGVTRKRFGAIRAFRVPLKEITVAELAAHLAFVAARAKWFPSG